MEKIQQLFIKSFIKSQTLRESGHNYDFEDLHTMESGAEAGEGLPKLLGGCCSWQKVLASP